MKKVVLVASLLFSIILSYGQNRIDLIASVNTQDKSISINQTIVYKNSSKDTLHTIFLTDWNNAYSSKSTPLAKRFEEEFSTKFHLARSKARGFTVIFGITNGNQQILAFERLKKQQDILKVILESPLLPNQSYTLNLDYTITLPDATFTNYGFTEAKNFDLKYWYITPAVYDGNWAYYSNKNLDDAYIPKANISITISYPKSYSITSELDVLKTESIGNLKNTILTGNDRIDSYLSLHQNPEYSEIKAADFTLVSNLDEKGLSKTDITLITERVSKYLTENLGEYPHQRLMVSTIDYGKSPLYGLNQLPDIIRPFPANFQYELKLVKTALRKYIDNIHLINPRKDHWLNDGLAIYFLMKYVEDFYPDTKFLGTLANYWGVRSFHIADLDYNFQYYLYSMEMQRKNNDQPLTTAKDSLLKFNANIASRYKAGLGLHYLDDYAQDTNLRKSIGAYLSLNRLKDSNTSNFQTHLKNNTNKNIDWFFTDYISTRKKIDFKIKKLRTKGDSIELTIKNKRANSVPISLFSLRNDTIINKIWVDNIGKTKTIVVPKNDADRLVLDYDNIIPEFNQRDNYRSTTGAAIWSKPFQFRLFKDIEDPYYNQVFLMPLVQFNNIYDGLTLGTKFYNKTILRKRLNYKFSPQYALNSKSLTGSGTIFYTHNLENQNLFDITYGIAASYQSFGQDAFFRSLSPNISFTFRQDDDFRSDKREVINLRYVDIARTIGPDAIIENLTEEPDYGILNLRYINANPGIINFSRFSTDFQLAQNFSKFSLNYEYRKLTKNNRNINFRFFAGTFLKNNTDPNSDFFSFALDRPTDYLFDFNYFGRSEASGIFSQQIIIAEGGFKSQLDTPFANQWMVTGNFITSIWRYIQFYGDVGLVKNRFSTANFVYDSGIRLNLVEDYFEIYFPLYSNNGWEIGQPNYDQRIRFMFTIDPEVLLGLFRRKWY